MQYAKVTCEICKQTISKGGAAFTAHMRCHVRKKEAIEYRRGRRLLFVRPDFNIVDSEPYAKLGNEPLPGQPKEVWELPNIKAEMPMIDPAAYFITSGEAVRKADKLVQDVYALAAKCRSFRDKLRQARGDKKYLETSRENGVLLIKVKTPRDKSNINDEEKN